MLGFFRKPNWETETIPRMEGSAGGVHVLIASFPCRVDPMTGKRSYAYDDFGVEFIEELSYKQLANFEQVRQTLAFGASKTVSIKLRNLSCFTVEVTGPVSTSERQFYSDLADALIDAFKTKGIHP